MDIIKLGTEYGKHYAVLELLTPESIFYSFGVGEDISFDVEIINRVGCDVFAFDPTPKSVAWMENNQVPSKFKYFEYGLSNKDGTLTFDPPPRPEWASYKESPTGQFTFPVKKLSTIMGELGHDRINFLKLDIEGSEYSVIDNLLEEGINPIQMSIEFHGAPQQIVQWVASNQQLVSLYKIVLYPDNEIYFILKDSIS